MHRRDLLRTGFGAFVASATVPAWAQRPPGRVAAAARLRRAVASEITSLDPQRPTGSLTAELGPELFCALTRQDAAGRLGAAAALEWATSEDGLRWTFRLRPGMKWSDGRSLAAADVVYSLRRMLAPETAAREAERLLAIGAARDVQRGRVAPERLAVRASGPDSVVIELERPDVGLPWALSTAYLVPPHVIEARGREWAKPNFLVTNGPYVVDAWAPGAKVVNLRRNRHFYDAARVAIERVDWLTGYDDATRLRLFRLGEADIATIEDAGTLAIARREFAGRLRSSPESAVGWIGLNTRRKPLDDPRLRRALSLAIDRKVLAERVRGLGETPTDAALPPGLPDHAGEVLPDYAGWPMARRLAAGRELVAALRTPAGGVRRLTIGYPASPTLRKVFLAVAAMWKMIGITADLQPLDGRAYTAALLKGEFDVFSYSTFALVPTAGVFLDRFASDSAVNVCFYASSEFDAALFAAQRQLTTAGRAREYARAEALLLRDLPILPLYRGASNRLISARVRGWVDHPGHAHPSDYLGLA
ncbi:MAG: peptide ABC transporter substrate-binding protein [Steroidobacteraceae bacterium]